MQKALQQILTTGERPLRIDFIRKYVDDLLLAVHKDDVCRILEIFNAFHTRIQFTMEIEEQGTLAYLDLRIHRMEGGQMYTTWYSKPCASHRMLNYSSAHSKRTVINVARNFIRRVTSLTTKPGVNNTGTIEEILKLNDFPRRVINHLMRRETVDRDVENATESGRRGTQCQYFPITYMPGTAEKMKKIITSTTGCGVAFSVSGKNNRYFSRVKDPVPKLSRSGVVYSIPCADCPKRYVGQTKQYLKMRIAQHKRSCRGPEVTGEQDGQEEDNKTALWKHWHTTGHMFKFDDVEILDTQRHYTRRLITEMLHIQENLPLLVNSRRDVERLSSVYTNLIALNKTSTNRRRGRQTQRNTSMNERQMERGNDTAEN
ncbi:uncharacterized protein LOC129791934 [Lutzomyia longipalpis]|uniref:uncharacterized protein LOC129791934 n=1 Tax=Lutzomyia longipalpis TaxID=7200 RepID=UPI002483707D|nr:uncharacterized protein LOC129791934 [Lutzomyia longipalpis]